jgi:hypothetical protein
VEELVAAIRAALDETERIARDVEGERWYFDLIEDGKRAFEDRINSNWVLRQVAKDRKILELHGGSHECTSETDNCVWVTDVPGDDCETVLALAEAHDIEVSARGEGEAVIDLSQEFHFTPTWTTEGEPCRLRNGTLTGRWDPLRQRAEASRPHDCADPRLGNLLRNRTMGILCAGLPCGGRRRAVFGPELRQGRDGRDRHLGQRLV